MNKCCDNSLNKIFFIQIMRIIGCVGVFTGHFLGKALPSEMSGSLLKWLRHGPWSRTVFSYCWQGDSDVVMFLVLSGFFITYAQNNGSVKFSLEKLTKKLCYVFVPALIVLFLSIGCHYIIYILGFNSFGYDSLFSIEEIYLNIKGLTGGGYRVNFSYQLWYISSTLICYMISYIYIRSTDNKYIRCALYPVFLFWAWKRSGYVLCAFVIGMICGEIGSCLNSKDCKGSKWGAVLGISAFMISPFLFNQQHTANINKVMLGLAIGVFVLGMLVFGGKITDSRSVIIDWLDKNSFAFYLIHVLFIDTISNRIYILGMNLCDGRFETGVILIDYTISLAAIWCLANLFEKYIIYNVMRCVSGVIRYLKKKMTNEII